MVIPLTATGQDGATSADYSVPDSVTFESGETTKDVTFTATDDAIDDDGEKVLLEFGTLPDGVTPGTVPSSTVSIIDDDAPASVAVSWAQTAYTVAEGGSVTVTAELDDDPEKTVVVPIARTDQGGAEQRGLLRRSRHHHLRVRGHREELHLHRRRRRPGRRRRERPTRVRAHPAQRSNAGDAGQHTGQDHRRRRPAGERQLPPGRIYRRRGRHRNCNRRARRRPGAHGGHTRHGHSPGRGDRRRLLRCSRQRHLRRRGNRADVHLHRHRRHGGRRRRRGAAGIRHAALGCERRDREGDGGQDHRRRPARIPDGQLRGGPVHRGRGRHGGDHRHPRRRPGEHGGHPPGEGEPGGNQRFRLFGGSGERHLWQRRHLQDLHRRRC